MRSLGPSAPIEDMRGFNLLLTPAVSLLDNVEKFNKYMGRYNVLRWPVEDRENLKCYGRNITRRKSGPLRTLRNKQSAHHDPSALWHADTSPRLEPRALLEALAEAFFVLILRLNDEGVYSWIRWPDPNRADLAQLRHPGAIGPVTLRADDRGRIVEIVGIHLGGDPRWNARATVDEAIAEYNRLAKLAVPSLPPLILRAMPSAGRCP
jgi:hypothetical protein